MSGSRSSRVRVVVGVMVMTLAMAAAAYTGHDLVQAANDEQWAKVRQILSATNAGQDLDPNMRYREGTAIYYASAECEAGIVQQLVLANADVNLPDTLLRATPVMLAAYKCSTSTQTTLRELISAGADLTLTDKEGDTALHWAVWGNNPTAVPLLLEAGAPTGVQNNDGLTPAQYARQRENVIIADTIDKFTGIKATTTPTITTGFTSVEAIDVYLIGGSVCFAVGYILYLLL